MKEGYRYVRQYVDPARGLLARWALYEVKGGKAKRVGTAITEMAKREFLEGV